MPRRCRSGHHPRRPPAAVRHVWPRHVQPRFDFDAGTRRRHLHHDAQDRDLVYSPPRRRHGAHRATNSELVTCSHDKQSALFYATLSRLRCTGLIVTVQLSLEPALRYKKRSRLTTWSTISTPSSRDPRTFAFGGTHRVSSADRTVKVRVRLRPRLLLIVPTRALDLYALCPAR